MADGCDAVNISTIPAYFVYTNS